ncbi:BQ5605_C008g04934 [Microbotryum silenes-dioicae]|uniref:BQ5605_C008g04934 protein n=1 Tax=Microbotryum silenes-dioicae TaxID=796604 RepID=A0A2X0P7C2_9BASI|nr:BQ5605_C008g04934 [Microbotryum silenes-dioicae]
MSSSSSSSSSSSRSAPPPSYFPTYALDQAFCGIGAGIVSTLCMQPLDLLKVQFQVATTTATPPSAPVASPAPGGPQAGVVASMAPVKTMARASLGHQSIWNGLTTIVKERDGIKGLYRGITPNLVGNATSWGLYFLWYTMLKNRAMEKSQAGGASTLSPAQHLLASAESGVITAVMTNPLWVVKTRMFTTSASQQTAYKGVLDGLYRLATEEGVRGLGKGLVLALIGVSNGAIQFMTYEELKGWRQEVKRRRLGPGADESKIKELTNTEYILMSGSAKLVAIGLTYPYQVVRSRIQYQSLLVSRIEPYKSIPDCIRRTYLESGWKGFYKGLGTNAVRILPGTCVTFVVYEQLSRGLERRARRERDGRGKEGEVDIRTQS